MKKIVAVLLMFLWPLAQGNIAFEMVHTSGHPIRVAMPKFESQELDNMISEMVHNVVKEDLKRSGYVQVVDGATDMTIKGVLTSTPKGFDLSVQLDDKEQLNVEQVKRVFHFDQIQYRDVGHQVSDFIYQQMTGYRGIFSTKIAYIHKLMVDQVMHYRLEVSDADGARVQILVDSQEPIMTPRWSPDGTAIMYVSFEREKAAIFIQNLITGKRDLIADFPGINNAPTWHPSGQKVAFTLTIDGSPNIYEMDLKTRKLTALTHGWSINTEPYYTSNGQKLYFTSNRSGSPQIYTLDFKSNEVKRLTFNGRYNASPIINQDDVLAMLHHAQSGFSIAVKSQDDMTVLVDSQFEQTPSFAPNGQFLVYSTLWQQKSILGVVSVDGNIHMRLLPDNTTGEIQDPDWSPWLA